MSIIIFISILMLVTVYSVNFRKSEKKTPAKGDIWTTLFLAFAVRIIFACFFNGHESDMNCFNAWSGMAYNGGFFNFYSGEQFADYPPGYIYILYVIGFIKSILPMNQKITYILLKLPAILCDIAAGYVVYRLSEKKGTKPDLIASLYLFNPVVILNSAVWGQVDSVFTLPVLLMICFILKKNLIASYFMFAIAIFIKPQALFYAPILLAGIIEQVFIKDFSVQKLFRNLFFGLLAILSIFILAMPFGLEAVIKQYQTTLASYKYVSVNAYNLWTMLGLNWSPLKNIYSVIGYGFIVLSTILCLIQIFKRKTADKYFYFGALLCFSVYVLSVKMHERYAFPAVLLLLCAFAISGRIQVFKLYGIISSLMFVNMAHVLFYYNPETYSSSGFHFYSIIFGFLMVVAYIVWLLDIFKKKKVSETVTDVSHTVNLPENFKITKKDLIAIAAITIAYSVIALCNLGNTKAPQTFSVIKANETVSVDLGKNTEISEIKLYNGFYEISNKRAISIKFIDEESTVVNELNLEHGAVFYWNEHAANCTARYIEITPTEDFSVFELAILNSEGKKLLPVSKPIRFFDEQSLVPENQTFRNSTYFDEIYHARTAYEFLHGLPVYEWTHPPLGKIFISIGVKLFGMTPFGWRISGTLFGIFMIPVLYIFIKKMFGITWIAVCGATLLSADFMHFAQSRIATIDVYVTFFIMCMYLFMFIYYRDGLFLQNRKKGHRILALCGISMGLAVSTKWTGFYAGAGIALIFLLSLVESYKKEKKDFIKKLFVTGFLCVIFFIIVPAIIYTHSYLPYMLSNNDGFMGVIRNQRDMYIYHSKTVVDSTHPFSSLWYEWILNLRPIWYYSSGYNGLSESISSFGNPLIWWSGFLAFIYCVYKAINKGDKNAVLLSIAYLSGIIPWTFVSRTTYIYHYFPCVPYLVIMLCYVANSLMERTPKTKKAFIAFTVVAVVLFALFYPAISGMPVKKEYLEFLKWLPRWQII